MMRIFSLFYVHRRSLERMRAAGKHLSDRNPCEGVDLKVFIGLTPTSVDGVQ